jgi:hypothetical protein
MKELVLEFRLSGTHLPKEVLDHSQVLHLLKFDTDGYLMICKMPRETWISEANSFPTGGPRHLIVRAIGEQGVDNVLLEVSGLWLGESDRRSSDRSRTFEFFKSLEKLPLYQLKPPTIESNSIRVFVVANSSEIQRLLNALKTTSINFKVVKLDKFVGRTDSPLLELTSQQARVLRLAQTMGYYDIPRKTKTEDLARILGMDKGTVGDHLRRAEKHVFENLLTQ